MCPVYPYDHPGKPECPNHPEFETEGRITDPPLQRCPRCRTKVKRLISARTGFVLKGIHWAYDGYSDEGSSCPR